MLTRDSHALEGTESSLLRRYTNSRAKNSLFQTIIFSYTTNLGTEETFLVKRSSGDNKGRCIPRLTQKTLNGKMEAQRMITNNIRAATDKQRFTVV